MFTCLRQKLSTQCKKPPCALKYGGLQHNFTNSLQNATKLPTCATQIYKVAKGITNAPNLRQTYCNKKTEAKNASVFSANLFYFTRVNLPMAILFLVVASNRIIPLLPPRQKTVCTVVHFAPCSWAVCKRLQVTLYSR